ncbi:MAG: BON domain-containing protein [Chloroflexota bacterium]|nr:BON domain-containing protein [Chloroflexota bacterium]
MGTRVCFEDRWQGHVSALDVTEDWEALNLTVSSGVLFFRQSVKLPMSAVKSFTEEAVYIAASSTKAFAREIPPIAAPARPVSSQTPVSRGRMRLSGVILDTTDRRVTEVLVSRGLTTYRVPISELMFDRKTLMFTAAPEQLREYRADADILGRIRRAITEDEGLTPDDKRNVTVDVEGSVVTLGGNVRVKQTGERIDAIARRVPGIIAMRNEIIDDFALESAIGMALDRQALSVSATVHVRSNLGQVTLYGTASSPRQAEDIIRAVAKVPGVRQVKSLLAVSAAAAAR